MQGVSDRPWFEAPAGGLGTFPPRIRRDDCVGRKVRRTKASGINEVAVPVPPTDNGAVGRRVPEALPGWGRKPPARGSAVAARSGGANSDCGRPAAETPPPAPPPPSTRRIQLSLTGPRGYAAGPGPHRAVTGGESLRTWGSAFGGSRGVSRVKWAPSLRLHLKHRSGD